MYISATIYHIRKRTAMGRMFLRRPLRMLHFILFGNIIETKLQLRLYKLITPKQEFKEWEEMNARIYAKIKKEDEAYLKSLKKKHALR